MYQEKLTEKEARKRVWKGDRMEDSSPYWSDGYLFLLKTAFAKKKNSLSKRSKRHNFSISIDSISEIISSKILGDLKFLGYLEAYILTLREHISHANFSFNENLYFTDAKKINYIISNTKDPIFKLAVMNADTQDEYFLLKVFSGDTLVAMTRLIKKETQSKQNNLGMN